LQSLEAVKILTGIGEPLVGRLTIFDALDGDWETITIHKDPSCEKH
jgi:adenylyltransferase/sulfurtransferase